MAWSHARADTTSKSQRLLPPSMAETKQTHRIPQTIVLEPLHANIEIHFPRVLHHDRNVLRQSRVDIDVDAQERVLHAEIQDLDLASF